MTRNEAIEAIKQRTQARLSDHWRSCLEYKLAGHTAGAHAAVDALLADYFLRLQALGEPTASADTLQLVRALVEGLNELATRFSGLLETDERELLVTPIAEAAELAGLDLDNWADRDPTFELRNF